MTFRWESVRYVYAGCVAIIIAALAWITFATLELEKSETLAAQRNAQTVSVGQAMWRMEMTVSSLIAQEGARPYFQYQPFYPADRAYTRMLQKVREGEVIVKSPLLAPSPPFIKLYFQETNDTLTSPQVPEGSQREIAERSHVAPETIAEAEKRLAVLNEIASETGSFFQGSMTSHQMAGMPLVTRRSSPARRQSETADRASKQTVSDYEERAELADLATALAEPAEAQEFDVEPRQDSNLAGAAPTVSGEGATGRGGGRLRDESGGVSTIFTRDFFTTPAMSPLWRQGPDGPELFFVRSFSVQDQRITQGVWIDWPSLRTLLLNVINDIIPDAELRPVFPGEVDVGSVATDRMLATAPLMLGVLDPGPVPGAPLMTPARVGLLLTWVAMLMAAVVIGIMLKAALDLSERRGRFVTAVTHELRTPLTTFSLYTEMLAGGLIRDDGKRQEYYQTLQSESSRLSRIVENVLEYARLGRGDGHVQSQILPLGELMDQVLPSLLKRAERSGVELRLRIDEVRETKVAADPQIVERVMINLVDNACKYAPGVPVEVRASLQGRLLRLTVRDGGPGIEAGDRKLIFEPFRRAKRDETSPNPGLGLGLALSRELSRCQGGDLTLLPAEGSGSGAAFAFDVPLA